MNSKTKSIFDDLFVNYPMLVQVKDDLEEAFDILKNCYESGGKILVCGNGGSASDAEHIVGELMKEYLVKRPIPRKHLDAIINIDADIGKWIADNLQVSIPAISLVSQSSLITAVSNDVSAEMIFAQQVYGYANKNDILWGISTSGNSKSVCNAVKVAKGLGIKSIGMTGHNGGNLKSLCDISICVPATETYRIQELHLPVYHVLCAMLENEFFG